MNCTAIAAVDAEWRDVGANELSRVDGGKTYVDVNLFGYSLAIGDQGFMVCKPMIRVTAAYARPQATAGVISG